MSLDTECLGPQDHRFPRVSGDEPNAHGVESRVTKFSPRERG